MAKNTLDETKELKILLAQIKGFNDTVQGILHDTNTPEIGRYSCFGDMAHTYNDLAECTKKLLKVPSLIYTFEIEKYQLGRFSVASAEENSRTSFGEWKNALFKFRGKYGFC